MEWQDIRGQQRVCDQLRRGAASGRLASSFLFVGPGGVGKRTVAMLLAQSLLCENSSAVELNACGHCSACQQVAAGSHPDLEVVGKPSDRSDIPLELLIGDKEHRMREGLLHNLGLKPFCAGRKVAIIDDADFLNEEGSNCLLKTLEEPPPKSVIILIGKSEQRQLPTIRSRCQIVRFSRLSREDVEYLLKTKGLVETDDEARELSLLSGGSLDQALWYADPDLREFRTRWLGILSRDAEAAAGFVKEFSTFVDAAGKDAPPRRARLIQIAQMTSEFFRSLIAATHGIAQELDPALDQAVAAAARSQPCDGETLTACIERCLDLEGQVIANANQATLIECVLDDLVQLRLSAR